MLEGRGVFAVRIDHDDMALRCGFADPMQDERGRCRFARTGRTEQGEVLAEQLVDIEACANIARRKDGTHFDEGAPVAGEDIAQVVGGRREDHAAGYGIAGHAAAEPANAPGQLLFVAFAEKVDFRDDTAGPAAILPLVADSAEQPAVTSPQLDLAADLTGQRNRQIVIAGAVGKPRGIERDGRARTCHVEHHADGLGRVAGGRSGLLFAIRGRSNCLPKLLPPQISHAEFNAPWLVYCLSSHGQL